MSRLLLSKSCTCEWPRITHLGTQLPFLQCIPWLLIATRSTVGRTSVILEISVGQGGGGGRVWREWLTLHFFCLYTSLSIENFIIRNWNKDSTNETQALVLRSSLPVFSYSLLDKHGRQSLFSYAHSTCFFSFSLFVISIKMHSWPNFLHQISYNVLRSRYSLSK